MSEQQKTDSGATITMVQQGAKALAYLTMLSPF